MKIECDKCGAKYSIADEKVRGKTFKIRCKKCSNVIIVRDKVAAVAAGVRGGGAEVAVEHAHPGWHLAINGETVGPMSDDDVRARFDAGEIDKDTAIWQEGFEDWLPLGDVDAFADLPDRASGGAVDDPFASANQDNYAAAGSGGAGAGAAGAAAAAFHAANDPDLHSPRVSQLTGQRNENSVLFSLDSLQALATAPSGPAARAASLRSPGPAARGPKGLATVAPSSEGSGLIDIRALGAMVNHDHAQGGPMPSSGAGDDTALPSFGGAGLAGLGSAPLVHPTSGDPGVMMAGAQPRSNAPLYVMMSVLIVAVLGLGAFILLRDNDPVIVETSVPAPIPSVKDAEGDEDDKKKDDEDDDKAADDDADEANAAESEGDAAEEGNAADGKKAKTKSRKKSSSSGSKSKPSSSLPDPKPTPTPTPAAKEDDLSVDCILDPSKCGKGPKKSAQPAAPPTDPNLPDTLKTADIKSGVAPYTGAAKACGSKHGAKPGTKVKVKLSISGASGSVSSAAANAPHTGTPLGNCVAAALKKSKFSKFKKSSLGVVYPVTM